MSPHAPHYVSPLPPEGAFATLEAARREARMSPHAPPCESPLPPEGAFASLEAARREAK